MKVQDLKPSDFAGVGSPSCSMWGKSEIEWMAHDYVKAQAKNGDKWDPLTREQVTELVPAEELTGYANMFKSDFYIPWFEMVSKQLTSPEGAAQVWRVDERVLARLGGLKL